MKAFEFENYQGIDDYILIEVDKACNLEGLKIAEVLINEKVRLYYDCENKYDSHVKEEVATRIKDAKKVVFVMAKDSSSILAYRNMVNYALEIKKEILIVKKEEFDLSHGLEMQLANIPTFIFKAENLKEELLKQEIISQDVIGQFANKINIDKKKQYLFIGLICLLVVLLLTSIFVVKRRLDYYQSPAYLFKDINNVDYLNIAEYGLEGIEALAGKSVEELDLSGGNFTDISGIDQINFKRINIAHNLEIANLNLIYYCEGLETIICSQDMLERVIRLNAAGIDIEVVN